MRLGRRTSGLLAAAAIAAALPLTTPSPAQAAPPTESCNIEHQARIVFWAVACAQPGEPVIGAFATWRNEPITFTQTDSSGTTVQAGNYLTMTPNREGGLFSNYVQIGLYAEKTSATTSTYGPRWTELGDNGGKTKAINQGVGGNTPDRTNHTYMLLRQDTGDQWDVLYDFNHVGTTTDQLPVPRGSANRIDIGLEVMGPQHVNVPPITSRVQYMTENKTWYRADTEDVAQVSSLGTCGQGSYTAPYCFTTQLTGGTKFEQWRAGKPGPSGTAQATNRTVPAAAQNLTGEQPDVVNGVNQAQLAKCMATAPERCLETVPGLAACIRTAKVCNTAALPGKSVANQSPPRFETSPADLRSRAAATFDVPARTVKVTAAAHTTARWEVSSTAPTPGLDPRGRTFDGFEAAYSPTGQLQDACWGQMCR